MIHKDLEVWKKVTDFVTLVYRVAKEYLVHEQHGLVSQMRRSAVLISF